MDDPEKHMMACRECGMKFDMRDLTQVFYHEVHRPIEVAEASPGVLVEDDVTNDTSNLKEGGET